MQLYTSDIIFLSSMAIILFACFFFIGKQFGFSRCSKNIFDNSISIIEESNKDNPELLNFFGVVYSSDSVIADGIINGTTTSMIDFESIQSEIDRLEEIKKDKPSKSHTYNDGLIDGKIEGLMFLLDSVFDDKFMSNDFNSVSVNNL